MERAYRSREPGVGSKPVSAGDKPALRLVKGSEAQTEPQEGGNGGGGEKKSVPQRLARLELYLATLRPSLEDSAATFKKHNIHIDVGPYDDLLKDLNAVQNEFEDLQERVKQAGFVIEEDFLKELERRIESIKDRVEGFEEDAEAVSRTVDNSVQNDLISEEEEPAEAELDDYTDIAHVVEEGSVTQEARHVWERQKNVDIMVDGLLLRLDNIFNKVEDEKNLPRKERMSVQIDKLRDTLGQVRGKLDVLSNQSLQSPINMVDVATVELELARPMEEIRELEEEVKAAVSANKFGEGEEPKHSLNMDDPDYMTSGEEETPVSTASAYTGGMAAGGASAELSEAEAYNATDRDFFDRGEAEEREARDEGKLRKQWEGEEVGEGEMHRWLALAQTQFAVIDGIRKDIEELKQKGVDVEDFGQKLVSLEHKTDDLWNLIIRHKSGQDQLQIHTPWEELNKSVDALKAAVKKKLGKKVAKEIRRGIGTGKEPPEGQGKGGGGGFFGRIGKWGRAAVLAAAGLVGIKTADAIKDYYDKQPAPHPQRADEEDEDRDVDAVDIGKAYDAGIPEGVREVRASAGDKFAPAARELKAVGVKQGKPEVGKEAVEKEFTVSSVKLNKGDTILEALDKFGLKKEQVEDIKDILKRKYRPSNRQDGVYKILNLALVDESIEWQIDKNGKVLDASWLDRHNEVVVPAEREKRVDGWRKAGGKKSVAVKPDSQHGTRPAPASGRVAGGTLDGKEVQLPGGYAGRDLTPYSQDLRLLAVNIEPGTSSRIEREDGSMLVVSRDSKGNFEVRIDPDPAKLGVAELGKKVFGEGFEKALSGFSKLPGRRTIGENDAVFKENMREEIGKYLREYYPYLLLNGELESADVGHANILRTHVDTMMNHLRNLIGVPEEYYKEN